MNKILLALLLFLGLTSQTYSMEYEIINDIAIAQKQAEETNTKLLIVFSADWCNYCLLLKNNLVANAEQIAQKYTVCYIDFDNNPELVKKYGVKKIPYSVIINKNNNKSLLGFSNYNTYRIWLGL